jgi:hypothetical protein
MIPSGSGGKGLFGGGGGGSLSRFPDLKSWS